MSAIIFPIFISIICTSSLWLILSLILSDGSKTAALVSFFVLLFFSYGHFYGLIKLQLKNLLLNTFGKGLIAPEKAFLIFWGIIFILGTWFILIKVRRVSKQFTSLLNITAIFLIIIPIFEIGTYEVRAGTIQPKLDYETTSETARGGWGKETTPPDIYYIILDAYGRADILEEVYHHENDQLLNYLTEKGFYIAGKSRANYDQTALSLASSLNMQYLDDLATEAGTGSKDRNVLKERISNNKVVRFLKRQGYRFLAFSSGYSLTEMENADIYLEYRWSFDEFQNGLIATTALPILLQTLGPSADLLEQYRERILYIFNMLPKVPEYKSPIFAFVHLTIPHPPFVFGPNGEKLTREQMKLKGGKDGSHIVKSLSDQRAYIKEYRDQLIFSNKRVKNTIDAILAKSRQKPIIILQSDHGPGAFFNFESVDDSYLDERFSILNSYYLPNVGSKFLYQEITPVNSFRVIFNNYFATKYKHLPNKSYYSTWSRPFQFINISKNIGSTNLVSFIHSRIIQIDTGNNKKQEIIPSKLEMNDGLKISFYGIILNLGKQCHAKLLEISLDGNDDYEIKYLDGDSIVASQSIQASPVSLTALTKHRIKIPTEAAIHGYDHIRILPISGDGLYKVGNIQLL